MKKIIIFAIILLSIVICVLKVHVKSIGLPTTDCEKVEILKPPSNEDNNNLITIKREYIDEYIEFCNNINVKKTTDYFFESPNAAIRFYYTNGECYELEYNAYAYDSEALLRVSKVKFNDDGIQIIGATFFYTDEIEKLITKTLNTK